MADDFIGSLHRNNMGEIQRAHSEPPVAADTLFLVIGSEQKPSVKSKLLPRFHDGHDG